MEKKSAYYSASPLLCGLCRLWLQDPVQTNCGKRVCRTCFLSACPEEKLVCPLCHEAEDKANPFYSDRAAAKLVQKLVINCGVCTWVGPADEVRQHWKNCSLLSTCTSCKYCQKSVPQDKLRSHVLQCGCGETVVMDCLCGKQVAKDAATVHQLTCSHHEKQSVPPRSTTADEERLEVDEGLDDGSSGHADDLPNVSSLGQIPSSDLDPGSNHLASASAMDSTLEEMPCWNPGISQPESASPLPSAPRMPSLPTHNQIWPFNYPQELEGYQRVENVPQDQVVLRSPSTLLEQSWSSQGLLVMSELQRSDVTGGCATVGTLTNQACQDRRINFAWDTSYDGHYTWKIDLFSEHLDQSMAGPNISIRSAPFYSSHGGYKVCLRLFLQGHGIAYGSHLSLALMLMRGEHDSILPWPFPFNVKLRLINQLFQGRGDVTDTIIPDDGEGFHRPLEEINLAYELSRFAPISILHGAEFVRNDEMYIECDLIKPLPS